LVQAVVVLVLSAEIQLALDQVQVVQVKHPSLREQLSLVAVEDHCAQGAIPLEPVAQEELVVAVRVHHLALRSQMQQVARNPEVQIPVAVVELASSKVLRPMVKAHKAVQELWLSAG
jgi:hypothetical protein